jgi:hypothetical protein
MHLTHASTVNAKVLSEAVDPTSVNRSLARYNSISQCFVEKHVVIVGSVGDECIDL